jgi:hypothetical protein
MDQRQEKLIKIAVACGWTTERECECEPYPDIPDYFNNRDAITKVVIALLDTYEKQIEYCKRLTAMQHADEPQIGRAHV